MADLFVKFTSSAGNYISTDSVNELDADTAHLQQSTGDWSVFNASGLSQDQTMPPVFGSYHGKCVAGGVAIPLVRTGEGLAGMSVLPSTEYAFAVSLSTDQADLKGRITVRWYDSGGAYVGHSQGEWVDLSSGSWTIVASSGLSAASAEYGSVRLEWSDRDDSVPASGDLLYYDAVCLREGADPSFVPSLLVVGNLDFAQRMSMNWATSASQMALAARRGGALAWQLVKDAGVGQLTLNYSTGGTADWSGSGWVPSDDLSDGDVSTVRVTRVAASGAMSYSLDGVERKAVTKNAGPLDVAPGALLQIGQERSGSQLAGDVYWSELRDGIDGPVVARFDAQDVP